MTIDVIRERRFDLEVEISISYECLVDDMAENKRIAADAEKDAIEELMEKLGIKEEEDLDY